MPEQSDAPLEDEVSFEIPHSVEVGLEARRKGRGMLWTGSRLALRYRLAASLRSDDDKDSGVAVDEPSPPANDRLAESYSRMNEALKQIDPKLRPTPSDIKAFATAVYRYMRSKDLTRPDRGGRGPDVFFLTALQIEYEKAAVEFLISQGETLVRARLLVRYPELEPRLRATDAQIEEAVSRIEARLPKYKTPTYGELIDELLASGGIDPEGGDLHARDMATATARMVHGMIKQHERKRWLILLEGIILGVITNGIYDALKESVISLTTRAPYPAAQVFEVEGDIYRRFPHWRSGINDFEGFAENEVAVGLSYVLHALCLNEIVGVVQHGEPVRD